jgi:hypothetical protein
VLSFYICKLKRVKLVATLPRHSTQCTIINKSPRYHCLSSQTPKLFSTRNLLYKNLRGNYNPALCTSLSYWQLIIYKYILCPFPASLLVLHYNQFSSFLTIQDLINLENTLSNQSEFEGISSHSDSYLIAIGKKIWSSYGQENLQAIFDNQTSKKYLPI